MRVFYDLFVRFYVPHSMILYAGTTIIDTMFTLTGNGSSLMIFPHSFYPREYYEHIDWQGISVQQGATQIRSRCTLFSRSTGSIQQVGHGSTSIISYLPLLESAMKLESA